MASKVSEATPQIVVQIAQTTIGQLQMTYRDREPQFWALAVAWHALRFAWYVLANDRGSAADKLANLVEAIDDYKRWSANVAQSD